MLLQTLHCPRGGSYSPHQYSCFIVLHVPYTLHCTLPKPTFSIPFFSILVPPAFIFFRSPPPPDSIRMHSVCLWHMSFELFSNACATCCLFVPYGCYAGVPSYITFSCFIPILLYIVQYV